MMPKVQTDTDYFAFSGGLVTESPALSVPPGSVLLSKNYVPSVSGGYQRIGGYESFSGKARPSDATYTAVACTLTSTPAVGATVTIGAATGYFLAAVTDGCLLVNVSGTIPASTSMTVSAVSVGTTASDVDLAFTVTREDDAQYRYDGSEIIRALISPPSGSGPIRGIHIYNGFVYCWRDNAGGTAGIMWKSSTSGWTQVTTYYEVTFSNANTSVAESDVLTQGGVTSTIYRLYVETGSLASGTNTGRMVVSAPSGGNYAAGAASSTGGGSLTLGGVQTALAFSAGGRYVCQNYNFYGNADSLRMYFCNGLDRAFEFDGSTVAPINSGASPDKPKYLCCHRKYLYLTQFSSVLNSSVGTPHRFVTSEGAAETAVGDTVTGLVSLPGEALGVFSRNSSNAIIGASSATFSLQPIRGDVGAVDYTVQAMSDTYFFDDRGVMSIRAAQEYGNFTDAALSSRIQRRITAMQSSSVSVVGAYVNRTKGHYVILKNDGTGLVMAVRNGKVSGFLEIEYPFTPSCMTSGEDAYGVERVFVGDTDGNVYEMDVGSSFDGEAIEAFIKIFYWHQKSPRLLKHYRKAILEMESVLYSPITCLVEFSYGNPDIAAANAVAFDGESPGGTLDSTLMTGFFFDGADVVQPEIPIRRSGTNMSMTFSSDTALDLGHTLQGAVIHFTPRRLQR